MDHIAEILPYAVAVALSPMPIAALILMLLSNHAKSNSVAFSLGWVLGLAGLVFIVSSAVGFSSSETQNITGFSLKTLIDLILGVLLVYLAFLQWKKRTKPGESPSMPKWMTAVETSTPLKAFGIGLLLAVVNVKNIPMGISVGAVVSEAGNASGAVFFTYLMLASSTIIILTLGYLLLGNKLQKTLEYLKTWLIANNATIMFVLFLILGIVLLSKGLGSLSG